jgi:hypothetical protein
LADALDVFRTGDDGEIYHAEFEERRRQLER